MVVKKIVAAAGEYTYIHATELHQYTGWSLVQVVIVDEQIGFNQSSPLFGKVARCVMFRDDASAESELRSEVNELREHLKKERSEKNKFEHELKLANRSVESLTKQKRADVLDLEACERKLDDANHHVAELKRKVAVLTAEENKAKKMCLDVLEGLALEVNNGRLVAKDETK